MTYPGERVQVGVKVVPHKCIANSELCLFLYIESQSQILCNR